MKLRLLLLSMLFSITGCLSAPARPATPSVQMTATASPCTQPGTTLALTVAAVGEIGVYLPPCYDSSDETLYPVLYLLPGFGGDYHEWLDVGLPSLADDLIASGEIPPLIVVTTDDTYEDLQPDLIITTLIPYVQNHYRASPERSRRAIAGGSLGGATAYVLAFQHPDLFASAGVFGNGLIAGQEAQIEAWLQAIPEDLKPRLFLNSGEQDTYMLQQAQALIPLLDKYGIQHAEIFSAGGHDDGYWLSNFPDYLKWLAEDWE